MNRILANATPDKVQVATVRISLHTVVDHGISLHFEGLIFFVRNQRAKQGMFPLPVHSQSNSQAN